MGGRAASFAHTMSKPPKPKTGKCSSPVQANEIVSSSHGFSVNQLKGQHMSPEDGSCSMGLMGKMSSTGLANSNKGRHLDKPEALWGHTSELSRGSGEGMDKRMMQRGRF